MICFNLQNPQQGFQYLDDAQKLNVVQMVRHGVYPFKINVTHRGMTSEMYAYTVDEKGLWYGTKNVNNEQLKLAFDLIAESYSVLN